MNKFHKLSFGLVAVLALAFVAVAQDAAEEAADSRPLVSVDVDGSTYSAPLNENVEVSEARRKFDQEVINSLFGKVAEMVDLIVVKKKGHFAVARSIMGIVPQAMANAKKLKQLQKTDSTPPMANGYTNKMGDLIVEIASIRTEERIDDKEVKRRADNLLAAIKKMTEESSTGLYMDWTKFTVDGAPLTQHVAPLLQWFRDNGYGMELKIFDGIAGVVKKLNSGKN